MNNINEVIDLSNLEQDTYVSHKTNKNRRSKGIK
jgi:hypothetical protein